MAAWWKLIALSFGDGFGTGSWKKRAARALGITNPEGRSWPQIIYNAEPDLQERTNDRNHTKRMVDPALANSGPGSWAKRLYLSGELDDVETPESGDSGEPWTFDRTDIKFDSDQATFDGATS